MTTWEFFDSPGTVVFNSPGGLTNLAQFQAQGRYSIRFRARKGSYENTFSFEVFVTNNGLTNFIPTVTLSSPPNGSEFTAPVDLTLFANVQDRDGTIARVIFYEGSTPLWTNRCPMPSRQMSPTAIMFSAVSRDNWGATNLISSSVVVRNQGLRAEAAHHQHSFSDQWRCLLLRSLFCSRLPQRSGRCDLFRHFLR
jgi:hypothetical protein